METGSFVVKMVEWMITGSSLLKEVDGMTTRSFLLVEVSTFSSSKDIALKTFSWQKGKFNSVYNVILNTVPEAGS